MVIYRSFFGSCIPAKLIKKIASLELWQNIKIFRPSPVQLLYKNVYPWMGIMSFKLQGGL
jgi:hypothetical protein